MNFLINHNPSDLLICNEETVEQIKQFAKLLTMFLQENSKLTDSYILVWSSKVFPFYIYILLFFNFFFPTRISDFVGLMHKYSASLLNTYEPLKELIMIFYVIINQANLRICKRILLEIIWDWIFRFIICLKRKTDVTNFFDQYWDLKMICYECKLKSIA